MLEIPPNVEITNQHFKCIADPYDLIFSQLNTATNKNQLGKLKTNDVTMNLICDIVSW